MALKDLLRTAALTPEDVRVLLDLAVRFKKDPFRSPDLLRRDTAVLYFNKPSTRTRLSMGTAITRLGGVPMTVGPADLQLGRGETIEDTAAVISRYARAFIIRTYADADVARFAAAADIPVVNALTDRHHPCQSIADLLTLQETRGDLSEVQVAYVGDGANVVHSLMEGVALVGGTIRVATPRGYEPDSEVVERARVLAAETGGTVEVGHDAVAAVDGADAIYTDTWMSMGVDESERAQRMEVFLPYQVNADLVARGADDVVVMHCLPDHRGEEVTAEVVDGPRSVVFDQAENRLHTAVAILVALLERRLRGRS